MILFLLGSFVVPQSSVPLLYEVLFDYLKDILCANCYVTFLV